MSSVIVTLDILLEHGVSRVLAASFFQQHMFKINVSYIFYGLTCCADDDVLSFLGQRLSPL